MIYFDKNCFRDADAVILSSVDDIEILLDDHILKSQTMRGSPYVTYIEDDAKCWESKLVAMQHILEEWLQCQMNWMYLEPIFSSEDIMKQMPIEARNFKVIDRTWFKIMQNTQANPKVLEATEYPDLLVLLKENNSVLENIQKGLNEYLEKKRLFFPRYIHQFHLNIVSYRSVLKSLNK